MFFARGNSTKMSQRAIAAMGFTSENKPPSTVQWVSVQVQRSLKLKISATEFLWSSSVPYF